MKTFFLSLILMFAVAAFAMEPPRPGDLERYRADGSLARRQAFVQKMGNHIMSPDLIRRKQAQISAQARGEKPGLEKFPYATGLPSKGTPRIFALGIDFPDYPTKMYDTYDIDQSLFKVVDAYLAPFDSLNQFYVRSSYGALNIKGEALSRYRAKHNRDYYTDDAGKLIGEALNAFDKSVDFSVYDNNGDGKIDYFIVFWTGPNTGWASFWWSWNSSFNDPNWKIDGKTLGNFSWISEEDCMQGGWFDPQIACHETGHAMGLPDYYDYDDKVGPRGGLGGFDMMDSNSCDHNAFSKWMLDWITPTVIGSAGPPKSISLRPAAIYPDAVAIMPGMTSNSIFSEYFLVQNRSRREKSTSDDYYIPGDGLVIWHVNATLNSTGDNFAYNNSNTAYKLISLMEADGKFQISQDLPYDIGDFYTPNHYFSPISVPNSSRYNLRAPRTGVTVFNIDPITVGYPMPPASTFGASFMIADTTTNWMDIGNAVDNTNLNWDTGGSDPAKTWFGQTAVSMNDGDAAQCMSPADGGNVTMGTKVTGPGPLSFYWKVSSEYRKDWLEFYIDGALQNRITGSPDWAQKSYYITPGSHYLMWKYVKDGSGSAGSDCGWVDKVSYPYIPFEVAVDNNATTWTQGGQQAWFVQLDQYTWGGSAAQSGPLVDGQTSQFGTTVLGPVTVNYFWKVSSEKGADVLRLLLDGTNVASISGEVDWTSKTLMLGSGKHTLTWQYIKNGSKKAGSDCGWVDKISITNTALAEGVDNFDLPWGCNPAGAWKFTKAVNHDGVDAVICDGLAMGQKATLQSVVRGPGTLKFYWMESKTSSSGQLNFFIDGNYVEYINDLFNKDWGQASFAIPAGLHTVNWLYDKFNSGTDYGAIDQVEFIPDWLTFEEALDSHGIAWDTLGDPGWFPQTKVWSFGMDAAQSGAISDAKNSFLEGAMTGPALLSFNWKVSSQPRSATDYFAHDDLEFYIDGAFKEEIFGEVGWQTKQYLIPKGTHKLTWDYYKDDAISAGADAGWVDRVILTPLPSLGEALDNTALTWETSGSADWLGQTLESYYGGSAARSGAIAGGQSSSLSAKLAGPGYLRYFWKVSCQGYDWDKLEFILDGVTQNKISGLVEWNQRTVFIPAGAHTAEWRYSKDNAFDDYQDCGWVDKVTFNAGPKAETGNAWSLYE